MIFDINPNEEVIYTYTHAFNSKSRARRAKRAIFKRLKTREIAVIRCNGNKTDSYVPVDSIRRPEED